jgi:hypothetical protein
VPSVSNAEEIPSARRTFTVVPMRRCSQLDGDEWHKRADNGRVPKEVWEVGTRVRQTEPHTPWSNAVEAAIRELKKGVGRQMVRSAAPKRLRDDCLEREEYVRSLTAHDIYKLDRCPKRHEGGILYSSSTWRLLSTRWSESQKVETLHYPSEAENSN